MSDGIDSSTDIGAVTLLASRDILKAIARVVTGKFKLGKDGFLQSEAKNGHRRLKVFSAIQNK